VKFDQKLGKALHQLTTIATPGTLLRWIRGEKKHGIKVPAKRGRMCSSQNRPWVVRGQPRKPQRFFSLRGISILTRIAR